MEMPMFQTVSQTGNPDGTMTIVLENHLNGAVSAPYHNSSVSGKVEVGEFVKDTAGSEAKITITLNIAAPPVAASKPVEPAKPELPSSKPVPPTEPKHEFLRPAHEVAKKK